MARPGVTLRQPLLALGILAAAWIILPAVAGRLTRASFRELQAPAIAAAGRLRDVQDWWALRLRPTTDLIEAGRDLARHNAAMELRLHENELLRDEVRRLGELLSLPAPPGHRLEIARVERRDFTAWWQQLVVRKGTNHGVAPGMPVVFAGGVVGRVREAGAYTSVVELLSSPGIRIAAALEGDLRPVRYTGAGGRALTDGEGLADLVPLDATASPILPRRLVTSGLGGVFPPGLAIGRIEAFTPGPDRTSQQAQVLLDPRLGSLREVAILIPDAGAPAR